MRLRPPRPPGERASRVSQTTEMLCTAEKVSVFGQKPFVSYPRGTTPTLASPRGLRSRGAVLNWFPVGTKTRSSACGTVFMTKSNFMLRDALRATPHLPFGHLPLKGKAIITSTLLCYFLSKKVDVSFLLPTTTVIAAAAAITAAAMQRIAAASGFFAGSFS